MPHLPDHRNHDRSLIAALAAGDAEGADLEQARALVTACDDCATLHHDLRAIAAALPATPAPARRRDFRLTPEQAATLRPAGWRRLLVPLAGPRFAFAAPLGGSLAALGIAGILVAGAASTPIANVAGPHRDDMFVARESPDDPKAELAPAAPDASGAPDSVPAPAPQPSAMTPVYAAGSAGSAGDPLASENPAAVELASPAASGEDTIGRLSDGSSTTGGGAIQVETSAPTVAESGSSGPASGTAAPAPIGSPFAWLAGVLFAVGSLLVGGRFVARRIA